MLTYISADNIYPVASAPIKNGVVAVDADGTINSVLTPDEALAQGITDVVRYKGMLVPGLINTHCHLELSHLHGKIPEHTGLPGFVRQVIQFRTIDEQTILTAMDQADRLMYDNGIVAVGDISNRLLSKSVKLSSPLYYHTFIETMGFNPAGAAAVISAALQLKADFSPLKTSIVPHAPYSVSEDLFKRIYDCAEFESPASIHNQETEAENSFFENKTGAFLDLYDFLGLDISFYQPSGKSSLQTVLPWLTKQRTLLVHNTITSLADIDFAKAHHENLYWCLCPNANLYIENRLPDVKMLRDAGLKITLGTDSLASNHQLSILSEMRTLQDQQDIEFKDLLLWATLNGAEFLGIDAKFGTLAAGKRPGINLIEFADGTELTEQTRIKRLY